MLWNTLILSRHGSPSLHLRLEERTQSRTGRLHRVNPTMDALGRSTFRSGFRRCRRIHACTCRLPNHLTTAASPPPPRQLRRRLITRRLVLPPPLHRHNRRQSHPRVRRQARHSRLRTASTTPLARLRLLLHRLRPWRAAIPQGVRGLAVCRANRLCSTKSMSRLSACKPTRRRLRDG